MAKVDVGVAKDRGVGGPAQPGKNPIFLVRHAARIGANTSVKYRGVLRARRRSLHHLFKRELVPKFNGGPIGDCLRGAAQLIDPEPFQRRVANGKGDIVGVWQQLENIVYKLG